MARTLPKMGMPLSTQSEGAKTGLAPEVAALCEAWRKMMTTEFPKVPKTLKLFSKATGKEIKLGSKVKTVTGQTVTVMALQAPAFKSEGFVLTGVAEGGWTCVLPSWLGAELKTVLTPKARQALVVLGQGGYFRKALESGTGYFHAEQFQTRLRTKEGQKVKGIGFKTFTELLDAGWLASRPCAKSSTWPQEWQLSFEQTKFSLPTPVTFRKEL